MLAFFNALSPWHVLLVLVVALLLFGNRLPEVARSIGRAFNEFKKGLRDVSDDVNADDDKPETPKQIRPPKDDTVSREEREKQPAGKSDDEP
jgi:sec-independent protein translocase protein TatA